jgi:hypothetical protein
VSFKAGTAPRLHLGLWDNTAAAWRHRAHTIYTAGVPGALAEGAGTGTLFPVENWGGVWYRFSISATGVIAANTNQMFLRVEQPANLGTWFMFGANAWNASFPSSYQGPSLGTRNADLCTVPWYVAPQAGLWRYHRFLERGTVSLAAGPRIGNIGGNGAIKWELLGDGAAHYRSALTNNVDPVNASVAAVTPTYGQLVETLELLTTGGNLKLLVSVNGAADVAGAQSGAFPAGLAAQWSAAIAAIGSDAVGNPGYGAFSRVLVGLGAGTLVSTIADARSIPV